MTNMNQKPLLPIVPPEFNEPVKAVVKKGDWKLHVVNMITVDEDDVLWRFCDDNSELDYSADVIYWEYLN